MHGAVGALILLNSSSAFDTVDHQIMCDVLRRRFDVRDAALDWFRSYFTDRTQVIAIGSGVSTLQHLVAGVPQGSVFGPRAFIAYSEDVVDILSGHGVAHHLYADDIQGTKHDKPSNANTVARGLESCVVSVGGWCRPKRLQLNESKTEVMWFGSSRNLSKVNADETRLHIDSDIIAPSNVVRDLGVFLDSELNMKTHIARTSRACFYHLRRLRAVRSRLGQNIAARLVSAFVLSRVDYCNAILAGLPASTLAPLQKVINAAARLVLNLKPHDHITAALRALHWLPIKQRIDYKLCLLVHLALIGHAPVYLSELLLPVANIPARSSLRSADNQLLDVPRTRLAIGDRAFAVVATRAWNRLPSELRLTTNTVHLKNQLKTYLFVEAFHSPN